MFFLIPRTTFSFFLSVNVFLNEFEMLLSPGVEWTLLWGKEQPLIIPFVSPEFFFGWHWPHSFYFYLEVLCLNRTVFSPLFPFYNMWFFLSSWDGDFRRISDLHFLSVKEKIILKFCLWIQWFWNNSQVIHSRSEGRENLACCSPRGGKELDTS